MSLTREPLSVWHLPSARLVMRRPTDETMRSITRINVRCLELDAVRSNFRRADVNVVWRIYEDVGIVVSASNVPADRGRTLVAHS